MPIEQKTLQISLPVLVCSGCRAAGEVIVTRIEPKYPPYVPPLQLVASAWINPPGWKTLEPLDERGESLALCPTCRGDIAATVRIRLEQLQTAAGAAAAAPASSTTDGRCRRCGMEGHQPPQIGPAGVNCREALKAKAEGREPVWRT